LGSVKRKNDIQKTFCAKRNFVLLRMIYQSAENDLSFGAELFYNCNRL